MKRGMWHQLGDRGQKIALEQFEHGIGAGVVISPRDLSHAQAISYSSQYRDLGADILFDPQFYVPSNRVGKISTYEDLLDFRVSESKLIQHSQSEFKRLAKALKSFARDLQCSAVMSPAVAMQAGQPEAVQLNLDLLRTAKDAANDLEIPVYATVPVGDSLALSESELSEVLSSFTSNEVDAWVLMLDTGADGICRSEQHLASLCKTVLRLAQTGLPVMHGCAGPNCLLSMAAGATSIGVAHSKNMWRLPLSRFENTEGGGGGDAPPRLFSKSLWSTFVFPDELVQMPTSIRDKVLSESPWHDLDPLSPEYFRSDISKWDTNKHLIYVLGQSIEEILTHESVAVRQGMVLELLESAALLHDEISEYYSVKDSADMHQAMWVRGLQKFIRDHKSDLEYLDMLADE